MSGQWWERKEQRQIVDFPDGRDWRCARRVVGAAGGVSISAPCFSEPEDARPLEVRCPNCGGDLTRTVVRL